MTSWDMIMHEIKDMANGGQKKMDQVYDGNTEMIGNG
jgi:hypothetical protein